MNMHIKILSIIFFVISGLTSHAKTALVCGGGGFIGTHLVMRLKNEGYWVRAVDVKKSEFIDSAADEFMIADLREKSNCEKSCDSSNIPGNQPFDEVYQLAADMGGMGYIAFHDAEIMHNSALINIHMLEACRKFHAKKVFFSSSACVYPKHNQEDPLNPNCAEESAYPANPDTEYGWEKLFSERMYQAYARDYHMNIRIARFHNIFGPLGTWKGGKEKAPAALSRKIAQAKDGGTIEIWGSGDQTRSFLYIDECIEGIRRLMASEITEPVNIGSDEMISINNMAQLIARIANKKIVIKNVPGPEGVRGRNSCNKNIKKKLLWAPSEKLATGLEKTYAWINKELLSLKN
jgi:GDP-D-mannose 3', 5'-epimerase